MAVTLETFRAAYPEFASTNDALITRYLGEASIWVGPHWCGNDGADEDTGTMLYAAHTAEANNIGVEANDVTSIGSGSHKITYRDTSSGKARWTSTRYGRMFYTLMKRYAGSRIYAV